MPDITEKQIRKTIELTSKEALKTLLYIRFNLTSPSEISLVYELLLASNGNPMTFTPDLRADVEKLTGISGISTALGRIEKTGALKRNGKVIVFNPVFSNWNNVSQLLFKIV